MPSICDTGNKKNSGNYYYSKSENPSLRQGTSASHLEVSFQKSSLRERKREISKACYKMSSSKAGISYDEVEL